MKYRELPPEQRNHANGVISRFMDAYIRTHLVWTPEQMYCALYEEVSRQHRDGWYGAQEYVDGTWVFPYFEGSSWITSADGKAYILKKFTEKYLKNRKLARRQSPLIERARFGLRWDSQRFYDINYGLKNGSDFEKTEIVENLTLIPWSIRHVEQELRDKYGSSLRQVLAQLSQSPIEEMFYSRWFQRYGGNPDNPALLPEFCGARNLYYCYKDRSGGYSFEETPDCRTVNVRFDFAVVNFGRQTMLLLELDGQEYHKTKDQRVNDAVKRTIATNNGWQLNVITGTQIHRDIDAVFDAMDGFFAAP